MADGFASSSKVRVSDFEPVSPDVLSLIPASLVRKEKIIPLKKHDGRLLVAGAHSNVTVKPEGLALVAGCPVEFLLASPDEIEAFIKRNYDNPPKRMMSIPPELIVSSNPAPTPAPEAPPAPAPEPVVMQDQRAESSSSNDFSLIVGGVVPDLNSPLSNEAMEVEAPTAAFLEISPFNREPALNQPIENFEEMTLPISPSVVAPSPIFPSSEKPNLIEEKLEPVTPVVPEHSPTVEVEKAPAVDRPSDPSLAPEFVALLSDAVVNRATEILVTLKRNQVETRHRIRGTLVPLHSGKGAIDVATSEKIFSWMAATGEKQEADNLDWFDVRKELKFGDDLYSCHAFLTLTKTSKILTVRINSQKESLYAPSTWGMDPSQIKVFNEFLERKQGFLLFAGSDRENISGNINACARHLATPKRHVVAVEPFLESWMAEVDQFSSQGDPAIFTKFLNVAFRHAPDVVVANPLENKIDFEICMLESLKGRLVLGRSYAVDCSEALVQVASLGVEPYLVSSAVVGVVAKRTIRLNCSVCQGKDPTAKSRARELGIPDAMQPSCFYVSKGCETCSQTGFEGETDIFEILVMTPELRNVFNRDVKAETIRDHIKSSGLLTLRQVAIHKAINGQTSLAEVVRTTPK